MATDKAVLNTALSVEHNAEIRFFFALLEGVFGKHIHPIGVCFIATHIFA